MAAKKKDKSPAYDFFVKELQKNPNASYADIKAKAESRGLMNIYPIVYGRAKKTLGLTTPGAAKKTTRKKVTKKTGRGPGRPKGSKNKVKRAAPAPSAGGSFEGLIAAVRQSELERERYREALEEIRDVINAALND